MKKYAYALFLVILAIVVIAIFGIEIHYMGLENVPILIRILLFIVLNVNLVALFTLMFFVGKSLFRLYLERRNRVLGYKFKTKLVVILVVLTLIPSVFLFIVSSGVVTRYLDQWFDPQVKQQLSLSIDMAKSIYDIERERTLAIARGIGKGKDAPETYTVTRMLSLPEHASETIRAGFDGRPDVEVVTGEEGDTVRAVVPNLEQGDQRGVIIVETRIPKALSDAAEGMKESYQNYLTLESWRLPIKANYLLILSFLTMMIVFSALWVALKISRGITDTVQALALATEQVAEGNLESRIDLQRDDELGLLVRSFNHMVDELRENKNSLQVAYQESDRRRLIIESILENINSGVIYLDVQGTMLAVNRAACDILGTTHEQIIGRHYDILLGILKSDELKQLIKGIRLREFRGVEREVRVSIGDRRILLRIFITGLSREGNVIGTIAVFDDLTEIAKAQKALAWQEVARRMAHEIKNPLTPIRLSTEHMIKKWQGGEGDFDKVFDRATKTIVREVESLKRLVDEFSRFGKMPEIVKAPVQLSSIVESAANLYHDYKNVEIAVVLKGTEVPVEIDAEQFKRVLINIIDNALQAMQNQGRIDIMINHNPEANRVTMDIADNGPGIREEDKERLFLPYFSTKKDGTGLGLAIASRVITEHRGYIRVHDNEPRGTIFTIDLPIREG